MYQKECTSETAAEGEAEDVEEFVEQEGCPNEEDFNKWSHHCSPNTCDDEALKKALNDDTTVSFVFGLEVNWSLLQEKLALEMEADEKRKEQQRIDLLELNARRAKERQNQRGHASDAVNSNSSDEASGESDDDDLAPVEVKEESSATKRSKKRSLDAAEPKRAKAVTGDRRRSRKEEQKEEAERVPPPRAQQESSAKRRILEDSGEDSEEDFAADPPEKKQQRRRVGTIVSSEESDESSAAEEGKAPIPAPPVLLRPSQATKRVSFQEQSSDRGSGSVLESLQNLTPQSQQQHQIQIIEDSSSSHSSDDSSSPGMDSSIWECPNCTFHNSDDLVSCKMCR
jgi:hypothetical protein